MVRCNVSFMWPVATYVHGCRALATKIYCLHIIVAKEDAAFNSTLIEAVEDHSCLQLRDPTPPTKANILSLLKIRYCHLHPDGHMIIPSFVMILSLIHIFRYTIYLGLKKYIKMSKTFFKEKNSITSLSPGYKFIWLINVKCY